MEIVRCYCDDRESFGAKIFNFDAQRIFIRLITSVSNSNLHSDNQWNLYRSKPSPEPSCDTVTSSILKPASCSLSFSSLIEEV